ncbi:MAG: penicillin-binding protein [Deltaproteobacteria bacterium]|nr:penicillin-binding protein [Deltaproteobacteria bacterium]
MGSLLRATATRTGTLVREGRDAVRARPRRAASILVGAALVGTIAPAALRSHGAPQPAPSTSESAAAAAPKVPTAPEPKPLQPPAPLAGLDLHSIAMDDNGAVASAASGRVARLTLEPKLQLFVNKLLAKHKLPQAAVVMIEPSTGKILAYASRDQSGSTKDLNVDAFAPSASVFKVVTGAALVQVAGVSPDLKTCYSGGEQKIMPSDLKEDPKKDNWCATLGQAMGRSINTVFARLAAKKLSGPDLHAIATQMGYGAPIPFDVPVAVSKIELPNDTLGFARTAAGFWNTTLSPLHGAMLAATIANDGVTMRPYVVTEVLDGTSVIYKAAGPTQLRKAIEPATANAVEKMMAETVAQGTSYKAFHDGKGKAFLPGIEVAGKTGTLNNPSPLKLYTWFVGFAPIKNPKVAIAALVVNDPVWKVKANVLAREALQAYFAQGGAPGVQMPIVE